MSVDVIVVGAFHETLELCEKSGITILGIIDNDSNFALSEKYSYLGTDNSFLEKKAFKNIPILFTPDLPRIREKLYFEYCEEEYYKLYTLISPAAIISRNAKIEDGVVISDLVNISSYSKLGKCVRVNVGANIMHDSQISDFTTVAPNAVILGNVTVGELSYIGSNSTILPGKKVGKNVIIGAGSVVTKDIPDNCVAYGNPAKIVRYTNE